MRNLIKLIAVTLLISTTLKAQPTIKPQFKKLVFAYYDVTGSGKNKMVTFRSYVEINENKLHLVEQYFKGVSDTVYWLPDTLITRLNTVFNGKKKAMSYLKTKEAPQRPLGGDEFFLSYINKSGLQEDLILVDLYMVKEFYSVINSFFHLTPADKIKHPGKIKNPILASTILKYHNACTYLPNVGEPPPEKRTKVQ